MVNKTKLRKRADAKKANKDLSDPATLDGSTAVPPASEDADVADDREKVTTIGPTTCLEMKTVTRSECSSSSVPVCHSYSTEPLALALRTIETSSEENAKLSAIQLLIQLAAADNENRLTFDMILNHGANSMNILLNALHAGGTATYRAALISLINTLINGCCNYLQRVRLRDDLLACGLYHALLGAVECDGNSDEVSRQLDLFLQSESEDNLNGPGRGLIDMLQQIFAAVKQTPAESKLHALLSSLARLPADRVDVWQRIADIANRPPIGWTDNASQVAVDSPALSSDISLQQPTVIQRTPSPIQVKTVLPPPPIRRPRSRSRAPSKKGIPPPPPPPLPPSLLESPARPSPIPPPPPPPSPNVPVRELPTYPKTRPTNTIAWQTVPQAMLAGNAIWNKGYTMMITRDDCERLEIAFERPAVVHSKMRSSQLKSATKTKLLPERRAMNIGIVLARFRPLKCVQVVEALDVPESLDIDTLALLQLHFPTDEELMPFRALSQSSDLRDAELFCWLVARKPNLRLRIKLACLHADFQSEIDRRSASADALLKASILLQSSEGLATFFHRCLQFGNFINQGSFAGKAAAFKLNSLHDLLTAKGRTGSKLRFVDLIAECANDVTKNFIDVIGPLQAVKGSSVDDMETAVTVLVKSIEEARSLLSACGESALADRYGAFLSKSAESCAELSRVLNEIRVQEVKLRSFFCTEKLKLEEVLGIVAESAVMFRDALKEAEERLSRNRRATAGGESPSNSETAEMNTVRSRLRHVKTASGSRGRRSSRAP